MYHYSSGNHRRGTGRTRQRLTRPSVAMRRTADIRACQGGARAARECAACEWDEDCPLRQAGIQEVILSPEVTLYRHVGAQGLIVSDVSGVYVAPDVTGGVYVAPRV